MAASRLRPAGRGGGAALVSMVGLFYGRGNGKTGGKFFPACLFFLYLRALFCSVDSVAGISKTWQDIFFIVQAFVKRGAVDFHIGVGGA